MVLKIFSSDSIGAGVRADLAYSDVLFVDKDTMVARTDGAVSSDAAIRAVAGHNTLSIHGSVVALGAGILLGDNGAVDSDNTLTIAETGFVKSFYDAGVRVDAYRSSITNAGRIEGYHGIDIDGQQTNSSSSSLTNSGSIFGTNFGIYRTSNATEALSVVNTGTITGGAYAYYSAQGANAVDYVTNNGTMSGDVELGGGADKFDGRLGTLDGYVNGGSGNDTIVGGDGADFLNGDNDNDDLNGGAGDDTLNGGFGNDVIFGGAGNDLLNGNSDADELHGGTGDDTYMVGQSDDVIVELKGEGIDTATRMANYTLSADVENLILTSVSNIDGTGNELANTITGNEGNNTLKGMAGNDTLNGDLGADQLEGSTGNDTYIVDNAADVVVEVKGEGTDTVKSVVSYTLSDNVERLTLIGNAELNGTGNEQANTITGNGFENTLKGMGGNDLLDGGADKDRMEGGTGDDTYIVDNASDVVVEVAGEGTDTVKASVSYTLSANVEKLILTGTGDIDGTGSADADTLTGNAGKNILKGMDGNDLLDGGAGTDRLEGGLGNDTFVVDNAGDKVVEASGEGTDTVKASISHTLAANVEKLVLTGTGNLNGTGNELANTLTGNAGANILKGLAGNDLLDGGAGADRLEGGLGKDTYVIDNAGDKVVELSGEGTDTVKASISHTLSANVENLILTGTGNLNGTGNELANMLTGNAGANILKGMAGNDTLVGGAGADQLYGGAGKDMFVFKSAADSTTTAMDKIFDFSHAEGDRIDLHAIDANGALSGDQAFSFIGTSAFHNTAGELRFEQKSGDTFIHGDINGDGKADFTIAVDPLVTFTASDFLL